MTKEEREDAIRSVRMAFSIWESEYDTGEDWSGEHKARDAAIKALKQDSILDKVKQAREEMDKLASHKVKPISFDQAVAIDMCIKILDKLISEVEE